MSPAPEGLASKKWSHLTSRGDPIRKIVYLSPYGGQVAEGDTMSFTQQHAPEITAEVEVPVGPGPVAAALPRRDLVRGLATDNILYFQSRDHMIHAFLAHPGPVEVGTGHRTFRGRISDLQRDLGPEFYRVQKSYIVRLDAVRRMIARRGGYYRVELVDGTRIPVSRREYPVVRDLLEARP